MSDLLNWIKDICYVTLNRPIWCNLIEVNPHTHQEYEEEEEEEEEKNGAYTRNNE